MIQLGDLGIQLGYKIIYKKILCQSKTCPRSTAGQVFLYLSLNFVIIMLKIKIWKMLKK